MRNYILIASMVIVAVIIGSTQAQEGVNCVDSLAPCNAYINSADTPPPECCNPLKEATKSSLPCLCGIFGDEHFMGVMGFNIDSALTLPKRCGIDINLVDYCAAAMSPPPSSTPTPASSPASDDDSLAPGSDADSMSPSTGPSGAPTSSVTTTPGSGSSKILMSGFALLGSAVMWASLMF